MVDESLILRKISEMDVYLGQINECTYSRVGEPA